MFERHSVQISSFSLWERMCFYLARIFLALTVKIYWKLHLIMATPVGNLTVDEANAEFGKLVDQITAIDEKLKSGEFGEDTSAPFIAKVQELASLFARISQLCQRLNLPMPKHLWRMPYFKHWRGEFFKQNVPSQSSCSFILVCKNWVDRRLAGKAP